MTKEELEKEVEEYLENEHCENVCTCDEIEECKKGIRIRCMSFNCKKELIVNFVEPREKQIAELSKHIVELQNDKGELIDRCRELEAQIEKMRNCRNCKKNCEGYRNCTLQNLCYWEWDNGDIH